jgi:transcriptional regulator with PAS, ATPase and Fis domain
MEAKRSLLSSAHRHTRLALDLLQSTSNAWLEALAEHIEVAIATLRADFTGALERSAHAVELASRSGARYLLATTQGNFANLLFLTGDYESALQHEGHAFKAFPRHSDNYIASLDNRVRIKLAQNQLDQCHDLLAEIEHEFRSLESRTDYVYRHAILTRAQVLHRCGRCAEALTHAQAAIDLAESSADVLLLHLAVVTKAQLLVATSDIPAAIRALDKIALSVALQSPDVFALYEGVIASVLVAEKNGTSAVGHFERARRIFETVKYAPGLAELECSSEAAGTSTSMTIDQQDSSRPGGTAATTVQSLTTLILHAGRPELVAREMVELLWSTCCVTSVAAIFRKTDGSEETWAHAGTRPEAHTVKKQVRLSIGAFRNGTMEVAAVLNSDVESVATFNSFRHLVESFHDLNRARAERENRAALWPLDEVPSANDRFLLSGHMRELMNYARKIAKTNVNVLITGASGTGKEILARAIHDFSDRAHKPFVPFNCSAIPRDLLESQLFGHRRGTFTGADRDYLGLIRSARGGTLFLDEIGELGLDLQPKLLRFLESGEIAPLGEPAALTIDVRIVAATNINLEDSVRAGKFREDLFYRLNVVRLSIRPLRERRDEIPAFVNYFVARAADEFKKGHLGVAEETMERLILYRWPGNVRQLQNEMRRMVALAEPNSTLTPDDISDQILGALPFARPERVNSHEIAVPLHDKLLPNLARVESEMIKAALSQHHGKVEAVAKALGISRKGLYLKRQRLGL